MSLFWVLCDADQTSKMAATAIMEIHYFLNNSRPTGGTSMKKVIYTHKCKVKQYNKQFYYIFLNWVSKNALLLPLRNLLIL